jgi:aryl-alcohol dehydrogenase-like predicted oxidoreductase
MASQFNWKADGDTHFRPFGRTGVIVPKLCLGAMNFGGVTSEDEGIRIIHAALDAGLTFIDTADVYNGGESERIVGKALADSKRDGVFLATKAYNPTGDGPNDRGLSRYHLLRACEESLRRLNTDHIDLYQLHRSDPTLPLDETLRALDDLVTQGKVRYLGVSTWPAWLTVEAIHISERDGFNRFVSEQPPYNLLDRRIENSIIPMCQRHGIAVLPWSPLAGGILADRYPPGASLPDGSRGATNPIYEGRISPRARAAAAQVAQVAADAGMTSAQLALLWVTEQPGVTSAIVGPRTMAHLDSALTILDLTLTDEIARKLDEVNPPGSASADFLNTSGWMKERVPRE